MSSPDEIATTLHSYAEVWRAGDLDKILASYHDDIVLHYMGDSPLAGSHVGRAAAFEVLGLATLRSSRRLIEIEDVLVGRRLGALLAVEELGDPPRRMRRVLVYRVHEFRLRECWLYDEDQRFVDHLWSQEG
jgi:ketosteroid isomerase-like protein